MVSYDGDGAFSAKSAERTALSDRECQDATQLTLPGSNGGTRTVITWADNTEARGTYTIHRDGGLLGIGTDLSTMRTRPLEANLAPTRSLCECLRSNLGPPQYDCRPMETSS